MQFKSVTIEKMDEAGKGRARIAQLSAVDSDGDTYAKGAFSWKQGGGQWVMMIPAHDKQAMPFGKAWLHEEGDWAVADFTLNLDTQAGKEWHAALQFDLSNGTPVQEWSYGFRTVKAGRVTRDNKQVRQLRQLDAFEISPVLRGAGVGTGTMTLKSAELKETAFAPLIASLAELAAAVGEDVSVLSETGRKQLAEIHAGLGKALASAPAASDPEAQADAEKAATDAAVYGFLQMVSRRSLSRRG